MGKKYLNKNTKFKCQNGNGVWFGVENGDLKVKIKGSNAITDDCRLSIIGGTRPGQCNLMPNPTNGTPMPCSFPVISGKWHNSTNVRISGKGVLTSDCSIICPVNGCIKPFSPTLISIDVGDNASYKNVDISISSENLDAKPSCESRGEKNTSTNTIDGSNKEFVGSASSVSSDGLTENDNKNILCDYGNCDRSDNCKYLKTPDMIKETDESKNAAELKINMGNDNFDIYAGECGEIATALYGNYMYSIAHHHIIPVNQCFKEFPEIVKLANYYNYNINKAENGICLPTMNQGYDKQPFELRKKVAFNAMDKLGRQWHKGGHKYSCRIDAEIDSILPKPFKHYKDAVDDELILFSEKLRKESKCRADNYEQHALEFAQIMDKICKRIVTKLRRFEDSPRKSYPCYVSKLSFYYAFYEELSEFENKMFGKDE